MVEKSQEPGRKHGWTAGYALREESSTILRHLSDGCPSCAAGLQVFRRTGDDVARAAAALEAFETSLAASLAAADDPVRALHAVLAELAVSSATPWG